MDPPDHYTSGPAPEGPLATLLAQRDRFLAFLERRIGSREAAEDVLQDAYARSLERVDSVREGENVTAWFFTLLRNAVIDRHRRDASAGRALAALASELEGHAHPANDAKASVCACVGPVLETLKPEYRDAIQVVDLGDGELGALSLRAGITSNNAAVRLHRARQALGQRLRATCGECAANGCFDCSC